MISVPVNSVSAHGDMHHFTFLAYPLALKHADAQAQAKVSPGLAMLPALAFQTILVPDFIL